MNMPGIRIKKSFLRIDEELIQQLAQIPVAHIGDVLNRIWCMHSRIQPFNKTVLAGQALTVKVRAGDNLMLHKAINMATEGDILVIDAQGSELYAVMGELMSLRAISHGVKGVVLDGCIRDKDVLSTFTNFAVYAIGATPNGPTRESGGEINYPVSCGGIVVNAGDIIIGDSDGVVVIPPNVATEVLMKSRAKMAKEEKDKEDIKNLAWDKSWVEKSLEARDCQYED